MVRNGKPVPPDRIENRVIVIVGKILIDQAGGEILGEGTPTLDPSKTPKAIDAAFKEGPPKLRARTLEFGGLSHRPTTRGTSGDS